MKDFWKKKEFGKVKLNLFISFSNQITLFQKLEITCGEYQLDLIPIDDDLLSLELESSYRECFLVLKKNGL